MWLQLEVGTARSLRRRVPTAIDPAPLTDSQGHGRRALVVEAAHTYFPEAGIEDLPALAREEIAAGLDGRLRRRIAASGADDPALPLLRDELVAQLGGTADITGALTVVDRVYTGRCSAIRYRLSSRPLAWPGTGTGAAPTAARR